MSRCFATTKNGERCKNASVTDTDVCGTHTSLGECPICMDSMTPRTSRTINCNHIFHKKCLEKWKNQNKLTCPVCRRYFDCSRFKVTISIVDREQMSILNSNLDSNVVNTIIPGIESSNIQFDTISTDMIFDVDDMMELEDLLAELGTSFTDIDATPADAESMAESFIV